MTRRTMLGVWAHPDDEAYLSAALMADHRRRGDRVVVVTATLGEHGTGDPATWPPARLAPRRHLELRASLAAVGVEELHLLGYEDGTCADLDDAVPTGRIARVMAAVQPDLVVTFGPDGVTGHPDHRAVGRWATDAWARTVPTAELWYPTFTPEFHRTWGELNEQIGLWGDQPEPPSTEPEGLTWGGRRLPDELAERKLAALEAHRSQTQPLIELVGPDTYREWWRAEWFRRAEVVALAARPGSVSRDARRVA
jgi:LmbE family N-acetylglucosaminyl deacetylase